MNLKLRLQEYAGFPRSLRAASRFRARPDETSGSPLDARRPAPQATAWIGQPAAWGEVFAGVLPFLIYGLAYWIAALGEWMRLPPPLQGYGGYAPQGAYILLAAGLAVGWVKGFPRWSYAYLGLALNLGAYYSNGRFYGVIYGWRAWLPLLAAAGAALLVSRSLRPLSNLVRGAWNDWTRLSFALYAFLLPTFTVIFLDSDWGAAQLVGLGLDTLLLSAGAVIHLRSRASLGRVAGLQAAMILLALGNVIMGDWYQGIEISARSLNLAVLLIPLFWGCLMFLPGVVGLMHRGVPPFVPGSRE